MAQGVRRRMLRMARARKRRRREAQPALALSGAAAADYAAATAAAADSASEAEEGEEEELQLALDDDGRIGVHGPSPQYVFRAFPRLLAPSAEELEGLRRDCRAAFTARAAAQGQKYSSGDTFWVPAGARPATVLERLALDIFRLHTVGCDEEDLRGGGAEWWTQVIDTDDDIGWHYDRDYALEADAGVGIHPHLATVTYLSDRGGPTVIVEHADVGGGGSAGSRGSGVPKVAHLSLPTVGKHIAFDGRWLHGAPAELAALRARGSSDVGPGGTRYTFLVNVWLNHKPVTARAFKPAGGAALARGPAIALGTAAGGETVAELRCTAGDAEEYSWVFPAAEGEGAEEEQPRERDEEVDAGEGGGAAGNAGAPLRPGQQRLRLALPCKALRRALAGPAAGACSSFTVALGAGQAVVE